MHVQTFSTISLLPSSRVNRTTPLPSNTFPTFPTMRKITTGVEGVAKLLRSTKPHKATRPDSVPARILKEAAEELAPVLELLFPVISRQGYGS